VHEKGEKQNKANQKSHFIIYKKRKLSALSDGPGPLLLLFLPPPSLLLFLSSFSYTLLFSFPFLFTFLLFFLSFNTFSFFYRISIKHRKSAIFSLRSTNTPITRCLETLNFRALCNHRADHHKRASRSRLGGVQPVGQHRARRHEARRPRWRRRERGKALRDATLAVPPDRLGIANRVRSPPIFFSNLRILA
jgi:hypothetical protein